jgi:RNA recognition motif-containing protein
MNIFVTNLSKSIDEEDLEIQFGDFGEVDDINIWV